MGRYENKVVVVTGAGQGIGRAFARGFAGEGARLLVSDVLAENAARTASEIGNGTISMGIDVSKRDQVQAMIDRAIAEFGSVDVMVNNAGVFPRATLLEMDDDTWNAVMDVNLRGTFLCSQIAARAMVAAGRGGAILSIASVAAYRQSERSVHYSASKAGIVAMTRNMAVELAPHTIRVNAIAPGLTDTAQPRHGNTEEEIAAMAAAVPLGRMAQPEDIAAVAVFLASPAAGHITGQTIHVNGGQYLP
jgi:3-oxoacyl-[acyl-carrier protein] reductase